eukprot:c15618_g1_i2.p2 GENE.c15618_g1_i2~~c15618_g1_i2.p2  ORF type:complete len:134 (+),score=26.01 c15618_g1_i2:29-403(+)
MAEAKRRRKHGEERAAGTDRNDDDKQASKINWTAFALCVLIVLPGVVGAVMRVTDLAGSTDFGKSISRYFGFASSTSKSYRDRVVEFYREHNPTKLGEVNKLLKKYKGKEEELIENLNRKYAGR